jgi:hypothetical protein
MPPPSRARARAPWTRCDPVLSHLIDRAQAKAEAAESMGLPDVAWLFYRLEATLIRLVPR